MQHTIKKPALYLLALLALFSCKKETALDCFTSNGKDVTETRSTASFSSININSKIDATIFIGPVCKVEVTAGEHIIKNISTKVIDGALNVDNNNTCNFVRGYKRTVRLNITVPYLNLVKNEGVGTVRLANGFVQDTIVVRAESSGDIYVNGTFNQVRTSSHGNGDIYVSGSTHSLYVYSNGTNFLHAENLDVDNYIFVETYSIGDCYINGSHLAELDYNIWKNGNIYYTGQPPIINNVSKDQGKGRAIKK